MSATDSNPIPDSDAHVGCPSVVCSAVLSPCGLYRYELWRRWAEGPHVTFVMLNPSTADATNDDPTIRKCISYAKRWGFGALCVANLFAFRATDPRDMKEAYDPIGPDNDIILAQLAEESDLIIAAWGKHGSHMDRASIVIPHLGDVKCLHRNSDGSPGHPLYLRGDASPFLLNVKGQELAEGENPQSKLKVNKGNSSDTQRASFLHRLVRLLRFIREDTLLLPTEYKWKRTTESGYEPFTPRSF